MPSKRRTPTAEHRPSILFHLSSVGWIFLLVLAVSLGLLGLTLGLGDLVGASERVAFDRLLESRAIDELQMDPALYLSQVLAIQGPVQTIQWGEDYGGAPVDIVVVGGLEEGQTPLRIIVTGGAGKVLASSVVHATGTGTPDPSDPSRLALVTAEVTVIPVATFDATEFLVSVLGAATFFGVLMAVLGVSWERQAAALSQELQDEETPNPAPETPQFVTSLTRGKDQLSVSLRMAFFAATGRVLFVFGLIAFLYVYVTVYVIQAASVDWWVHHWVPWLRLDVFAALGLIAAFVGLFLLTFVQELRKKS
ncbi:MAG: hypothetical protein ACE5I4_03310 [Thermoplasmata archaeon]